MMAQASVVTLERSDYPQRARTVVYFVDSPEFGGTEQELLHLLAGLNRQRWDPIVFHHPEPALEPLLDGARRLGVPTKAVKRMQGKQVVTAFPRFVQELRRVSPAVFHAHLCWLLSCKYGLLAAALLRVPKVIATAQLFMRPPWGKSIELQQRLVAAAVDEYLAVSEAVARQLCLSFRLPATKVRVIPNSIPFRQYDCQPNARLRQFLAGDAERPVILTVARLDEQKGHQYLFEAMCCLPGATLVLAGSGPEKGRLEELARQLGINDRVRFLGHRTDIPELLASCDVFVLPSLYEGLPLSILEAMAAAKPVIATAVGGSAEAVQDGQTGILVPPADPLSLARALQNLLSCPERAKAMGAAGKIRAQRDFSDAVMVRRVTEVYEESV